VRSKDLETVEILVNRGIQSSIKNNRGLTPKAIALAANSFEIVEFMSKKGIRN
jgi:ankyrin repeat protein